MSAATDPEVLFADNAERLATLTARAIARGLKPAELLAVCLVVDSWREIADGLMPDHDWAAYRARGEIPIARGAAMREDLAEGLSILAPDIARALRSKPPAGHVHAVVCGERVGRPYAAVFLLEPAQIGGVA